MKQQNVQQSSVDKDHAGGLVAKNDGMSQEDILYEKTQDLQ